MALAETDARFTWFRENASGFSGPLSFEEPLSRHTYYRVGGPASVLAFPRSLSDLRWIAEGLRASGCPVFVMGSGSNLLVSDRGFAGVVVKTGRLNQEISVTDPGPEILRIRTGASTAVSSFLRRAAQEGWGGLEFLTGIPGSIGGVVRMNAGTHLGEAKDRLRKVEYFSLLGNASLENLTPVQGPDLRFEYRKNLFLPEGAIVWSAEWEVRVENPGRVKSLIDETLARRKATQPIDLPSCGSVFKNPRESGISAWQVIDRVGLRGHRVGDAQFSEKHSNFIVNLGSAKAADIRALIELARSRAERELGIALHEEVIFVGF